MNLLKVTGISEQAESVDYDVCRMITVLPIGRLPK